MHPANRLALWLWLASLLPWLERPFLYALAVLIVAGALLFCRPRFLRALPRIRWLLLAVGVIYGWTTPGEYLWSGWLAPTREGIRLGIAQMTRLLAIAASLQILLTGMPRAAIFSGLYILSAPLEWLGISRRHAAMRLSLTLEMVENILEMQQPFQQLLRELNKPDQDHGERTVHMMIQPLGWGQGLLLGLLSCLSVLTVWLGGFGGWS
ncbi:Cobalt transport protein [Formivibrio citricus]|uniref:Cobalt transport protein n=1 Tax=Formivibrio citricus TaxID=83765 RepID=A0A1I4V8S6_9NEIS|nr:CbiQ family ECF transporter T component [Formivibrio citricus]SFM97622.1 Cobalt transport protein [Formivibrio citricus]